MFGSLLSWMQDRKAPVFLAATANDISRLPPELMRKGRFDEVFFVDLPGPEARAKVFEIHLARRKRNPAAFDLGALAAGAEGFSGAEIEQAVVSALYTAFAAGGDVTTEIIRAEMKATRPLSQMMAERVAELRAWAAQRCVKAD
jgi:SpoVK/Ycf46/Vps4 family AAA+-type ATPase